MPGQENGVGKIADINLPVVDYVKVISGGEEARAAEALKLVNAFTEVGFALLTVPPGYDEAALFEAVK